MRRPAVINADDGRSCVLYEVPGQEELKSVKDGSRTYISGTVKMILEKFLDQGKSVGLLLADEDVQNFIKLPVTIQQLGPRNDLNKIAANLYSALRALDASKVDVILVGDWSLEGLGLPIRDRLIRASGG